MAKSAEERRAEMMALKGARRETASPLPTSSPQNGAVAHREPPKTFHEEPSAEDLRSPVPRETSVPAVRPRRVARGGAQDDYTRALPHSIEAEQGILGVMLVSPAVTIPQAVRVLSAEFFYVPAHQIIFSDLIALYNDQGAMDLITFTQYLRDVGHLDEVGGTPWVSGLVAMMPNVWMLEQYLGVVRDKFTLRQIIAASQETAHRALEEQDDVPALLELAHRKMEDVKLALAGTMDDVEDFGFDELLEFDPRKDPDNLIGQRWACRGFSVLWAGASGMGKSTLEMQLAIYWGCGLSVFGIKPVKPLKSLILQAENDLGDTGEQLQGVLMGIAKAEGEVLTATRRELIQSNVVIKRVIASTGEKFCALLESLVQTHKPDFVWIDPLFAFAGCNLLDAKEAGLFLREGLFPIAVRNKVCLHVIHHVGKPDRDSKAKSGWQDIDFQYLGFGSSEIQNGFRAVNVLLPVSGEDNVYRLILSKRGRRAGAKSPDGEFTNNIYLTHSTEGICWLQVDKPTEQAKGLGGQFSKVFKADDILAELGPVNGKKTSDLRKHMADECNMSKTTFFRLFDELKKAQKIRITDDGWIINNRALSNE